MWYHAHISWLRASVHGAIVLKPRRSRPYPFDPPYREVTIILSKSTSTSQNTKDRLVSWPYIKKRRILKHVELVMTVLGAVSLSWLP